MKFMKPLLATVLAASVSFSALSAFAQDKPTIGVVVKIGGHPWFNAMEEGIEEQAGALGWDGFMVGPTDADPALQVRAIEDLIARGVDAIGVVPNDAAVLEPVLKRARDAGIIVITHESPASINKHYNFELVSTRSLGEAHAKLLAEAMGGSGTYAVYVGGLTVPAHNAWADAAIAYLKENHPDMSVIGERFGVAESVDDSRSTALDLIRANPDIGGFLAFGSQGPIGAARAIEERDMVGDIAVVGLFSAGQGQKLVHSGAITGGFIWSPLEAGKVFVTLADHIKKDGTVSTGDDIEGLGVVEVEDGVNITADKPLALSIETIDGLAGRGL